MDWNFQRKDFLITGANDRYVKVWKNNVSMTDFDIIRMYNTPSICKQIKWLTHKPEHILQVLSNQNYFTISDSRNPYCPNQIFKVDKKNVYFKKVVFDEKGINYVCAMSNNSLLWFDHTDAIEFKDSLPNSLANLDVKGDLYFKPINEEGEKVRNETISNDHYFKEENVISLGSLFLSNCSL